LKIGKKEANKWEMGYGIGYIDCIGRYEQCILRAQVRGQLAISFRSYFQTSNGAGYISAWMEFC
jgi:hypothetical protein